MSDYIENALSALWDYFNSTVLGQIPTLLVMLKISSLKTTYAYVFYNLKISVLLYVLSCGFTFKHFTYFSLELFIPYLYSIKHILYTFLKFKLIY